MPATAGNSFAPRSQRLAIAGSRLRWSTCSAAKGRSMCRWADLRLRANPWSNGKAHVIQLGVVLDCAWPAGLPSRFERFDAPGRSISLSNGCATATAAEADHAPSSASACTTAPRANRARMLRAKSSRELRRLQRAIFLWPFSPRVRSSHRRHAKAMWLATHAVVHCPRGTSASRVRLTSAAEPQAVGSLVGLPDCEEAIHLPCRASYSQDKLLTDVALCYFDRVYRLTQVPVYPRGEVMGSTTNSQGPRLQ